MEIKEKKFGTFGQHEVILFTLENKNGMQLQVMNYGATIVKLMVPDRYGQFENVILGFDKFEDYLTQDAYFGATIGRVAGRITKGQFTIAGQDYQLAQNNGQHNLHGGPEGFNKQIWQAETIDSDHSSSVVFTYTSPAGDNNFPGELNVQVTYTLTDDNEWLLNYFATTTEATLFNPTNHVYFNLTGQSSHEILKEKLQLAAYEFAPVTVEGVPTGALEKVAGTAFDFRQEKPLSTAVTAIDPEIKQVGGLDHPFVFENKIPFSVAKAVLKDEKSGRQMKLYTTSPAVVIYTGNQLQGQFEIDQHPCQPHTGVTFETQLLPDAINHSGFGDIILKPGEEFDETTKFSFGLIEV